MESDAYTHRGGPFRRLGCVFISPNFNTPDAAQKQMHYIEKESERAPLLLGPFGNEFRAHTHTERTAEMHHLLPLSDAVCKNEFGVCAQSTHPSIFQTLRRVCPRSLVMQLPSESYVRFLTCDQYGYTTTPAGQKDMDATERTALSAIPRGAFSQRHTARILHYVFFFSLSLL
jgi:hypothetical protein